MQGLRTVGAPPLVVHSAQQGDLAPGASEPAFLGTEPAFMPGAADYRP